MPSNNLIKKSAVNPTALIVGGAGFLGAILTEALLSKNCRVVVLDNVNPKKENLLNRFLNNSGFALFNADINIGVPDTIESVDYIFHLTNLEEYYQEGETVNLNSLLTSAIGTKNVLEFARKCEAKLLLASTTEIYKGVVSPIDLEHYFGNYPIDEQKFSLLEAKRFSEALVWEYYKRNSLDVRIARLPTLYGPLMDFDKSGVLGSLLKNLLENHNLAVPGDGSVKNYYLYIEDAVAGLIKALFSDGTKGKIFSFVPEEPTSFLEIAYLLKGMSNTLTNIVFDDSWTSYYSLKEIPSPDRSTLREIKWSGNVSLKDGLARTLQHDNYAINDRSFKPGKLIEEKKSLKKPSKETKEKEKTPPQQEAIVSILDLGPAENLKVENSETVAMETPFPEPSSKTPAGASVPQAQNQSAKQSAGMFEYAHQSELPGMKHKKGKGNEQKASRLAVAKEKMFRKHARSFKYAYRLGMVFLVILMFMVVFVGFPAFQTYRYAMQGASKLESAKNNVMVLDLKKGQDDADQAFRSFRKAQSNFNNMQWVFNVTRKSPLFNNVQRLLNGSESLSKSIYFSSKGAEPYLTIWETLNPSSTQTLQEDKFSASQGNFSTALENLRLAESALRDTPFKDRIGMLKDVDKNIRTYAESLELMKALSTSAGNLLGITEKRSYLILFQNSNEIRATGGFIGSYAILEVEDGKIANLTIDDVYNPDGQLDLREILVESPTAMKELLGEDTLHIRNANWDPDFVASAESIKELFFKLDGRGFDGVVAVDLNLVEKILEVTGPVYLTAYDEEITSENIYERTQFHSEFNYQSGSDQKRSFLTVLGGKLLETIFGLETSQLPKLSGALKKSLDQKHILVYLPETLLSPYLTEKGWDGALNKAEHDYLYVVNSNVGGTKANYFVKNEMQYNVFSATRDGLLRASLALVYNHTGQDSSWPGGPYSNYLRVLTRNGSRLTGARLKINENEETDIFDIVKVSDYNRKFTVFEIPFVIDPQQKATITLEYDLSEQIVVGKDTYTYNLFWQKQPGTSQDAYGFVFNSPFGKNLEKAVPDMQISNNKAAIEGTLDTDKNIFVYMN